MNNNFSFLSQIQLLDNSPTTRRRFGEKNPTNGAHLRVFSDGYIYPSQEFVDKYNLEYTNKDGAVSNGIDFTPSNKWGAYPEGNPNVLFFSIVRKDQPKVDLFSSTNYNEDGTPKASVMDQGTPTAGLKLIELLQETYGIEDLFANNSSIDLMIVEDAGINSPDNIYFLPKVITRGEKKGQWTSIRRENTTLYPVTIYTEEIPLPEIEDIADVEYLEDGDEEAFHEAIELHEAETVYEDTDDSTDEQNQ